MRESLSALHDGEAAALDRGELGRHVSTCPDCATFAVFLLAPETKQPVAGPAPNMTEQILSAAPSQPRRGRLDKVTVLRLGLVLMALGELVNTLVMLGLEHGYGAMDHASHESLSFTVAVSLGLLCAAARPAFARAYIPVVGAAVALLIVTAAIDVRRGRITPLDELPHIDLLAGFVILCLLAHEQHGGPWVWRRAPSAPSPSTASRLRLVSERALTSAGPKAALRRIATVVTVCAAIILIASPARAHAVLEGSDPAPNGTLDRVPTDVTLRFDEAVTTLPTSLRVFGPDGDRVDDGRVQHPSGAGDKITVGLARDSPAGTYLVSWRVISADSHPVSGAFTFSVRNQSATPTATPEQTSSTIAVLLAVTRWLGYLALALLIGGAVLVLRCWPQGRLDVRTRRLLQAGALATAALALVSILLKGPYDAALGLTDVGHPALLREVLSTNFGKAMTIRVVLAVVACWLLLRLHGSTASRRWLVAATVTGIGLLLTFSSAGHFATGNDRVLSIASDTLHVGAMSTWLGGLMVLSVCVLSRRARSRGDTALDTAAVVGRFSPLALWCVVVLVATGSYQSFRQVDAWAALPGTTYGRELIVKLSLVAALLATAAFSRAWVARRRRPPLLVHAASTLDETTGPTTGPPPSLRRIRLSVGIEAVVGVIVLAVTATLVATEPAKTAYHPTVSANLTLGPDTVQVSAVPAGDRTMQVHLYVFGKQGRPTQPAELTAAATLTQKDVGPLPLKLERVDVGHLVGTLSVPVTGTWQLAVDLRTTDIDEYTANVEVPIR